ncbi:MAG: VTT domain-containing protein [archaeon]
MIDLTNPSILLPFIENHGYLILLVLMIIEGPIITYIAAFFSSLGYLNIWWVIVLSVLGNQIPDIIYYWFGRNMRIRTIKKLVMPLGITNEKIKWLEKNLRKHAAKAIVTIKILPIFPGAGLFISGYVKIPFRKFLYVSLVFNLIATLILIILGFYSGIAINEISKTLELTSLIIPALIILSIGIYLIIKRLTKKFSEKIKN